MVKKFNELIQESSLSRIWSHNEQHDCGAITAYRKGPGCDSYDDPKADNYGDRYTKKMNAARNLSLRAKLMSLGYSITKLKGTYPEGGVVSKEESYWVVDISDKGNLVKDIIALGVLFDQDSVFIAPKGAVNKEAVAYLYGTSKCPEAYPGWKKTAKLAKSKMGHSSPIYTSIVNGRPFVFSEEIAGSHETYSSGFNALGTSVAAKKDWRELMEIMNFNFDGNEFNNEKRNS